MEKSIPFEMAILKALEACRSEIHNLKLRLSSKTDKFIEKQVECFHKLIEEYQHLPLIEGLIDEMIDFCRKENRYEEDVLNDKQLFVSTVTLDHLQPMSHYFHIQLLQKVMNHMRSKLYDVKQSDLIEKELFQTMKKHYRDIQKQVEPVRERNQVLQDRVTEILATLKSAKLYIHELEGNLGKRKRQVSGLLGFIDNINTNKRSARRAITQLKRTKLTEEQAALIEDVLVVARQEEIEDQSLKTLDTEEFLTKRPNLSSI